MTNLDSDQREQVRRDAELFGFKAWAKDDGEPDRWWITREAARAVLAELEQAEQRIADQDVVLQSRTDEVIDANAQRKQAERERDEALNERDGTALIKDLAEAAVLKAEACLASVPALVEALREASTALSDASVMVETENDGWQVRVYQRLCDEWERADAALTVYEQSQGNG